MDIFSSVIILNIILTSFFHIQYIKRHLAVSIAVFYSKEDRVEWSIEVVYLVQREALESGTEHISLELPSQISMGMSRYHRNCSAATLKSCIHWNEGYYNINSCKFSRGLR